MGKAAISSMVAPWRVPFSRSGQPALDVTFAVEPRIWKQMTMEELEQQLKPLMLMGLAGDSAAQHQLLERCAERLRDYYRRRLPDREHDVEDLVQESLIAIHSRRASYDTQRPFTAWLHAIARYKLADHLRAHYRRRTVPLADAAEWVEAELDAPSWASPATLSGCFRASPTVSETPSGS